MLEVVSAAAFGAFGLHAHPEAPACRVEPPLPVGPVAGLLTPVELAHDDAVAVQALQIPRLSCVYISSPDAEPVKWSSASRSKVRVAQARRVRHTERAAGETSMAAACPGPRNSTPQCGQKTKWAAICSPHRHNDTKNSFPGFHGRYCTLRGR